MYKYKTSKLTEAQTVAHLHVLVNLVQHGLEEVERVLLLPDVHRVTPQFEHGPELLGLVELKTTLHQVTKHQLDLVEDAEKTKQQVNNDQLPVTSFYVIYLIFNLHIKLE